MGSVDRILLAGTFADKKFLPGLKSCTRGVSVAISLDKITMEAQLLMLCKKQHITKVISTSIPLLKRLLKWDKRAAPSLADYAGSHFWVGANKEVEVVFIPPLKQIITIPYGKFLTTRLITKLTKPEQWLEPSPFTWNLWKPIRHESWLNLFRTAQYICVDIETLKENATIRCIAYTAFWFLKDSIKSESIVIPIDCMEAVYAMREFNTLPAPKILQNGMYDIAYLSRYNSPLHNYAWDTAALFHSWLSELPKDLGFLNSFFVREAMYWKDLAETNDLYEYYRYNALDTWGTGNAFFAMMRELPEYAYHNYALEFPQQFPCHMAEMTGIKRDMGRLEAARAEQQVIIDKNNASLQKMTGEPNFNTNSPKQVLQLMHILGCKDLTSSDEKNLEKARFRHPLNARILELIIKTRKARKSTSTYLTVGDKAKEFNGRILYALSPHGTDTSRLASKAHHFWCGFNIQNQTRGKIIKQTYVADPGFLFAEVDLSQAETWDTAYISGDTNLIAVVNSDLDFHSNNASKFFGVPYDQIYDDTLGKVLDKILRDLSKRVNHGATYNMGAYVLIDTMGQVKIVRAKKLLGLAAYMTMKQVAEYLLDDCFHGTYPGIRKIYYAGMTEEVVTTGYIRSMAIHHDALSMSNMHGDPIVDYNQWLLERPVRSWTRRCFGNPTKSKPILNSYIAHSPQSLNAQTLNKAWLRVFREVAMHPEHANNIKLCAQVHDSILFQYRIGCDYICEMVRERMEIPVTIKGYDNVVRTFCVPADIKAGVDGKVAKYWSETE